MAHSYCIGFPGQFRKLLAQIHLLFIMCIQIRPFAVETPTHFFSDFKKNLHKIFLMGYGYVLSRPTAEDKGGRKKKEEEGGGESKTIGGGGQLPPCHHPCAATAYMYSFDQTNSYLEHSYSFIK